MKKMRILGVLTLLGLCIGHILRAQDRKHAATSESMYNGYLAVRNLAFQTDRKKASLPRVSDANEPWGAIMDRGMDKGTVTVIAFSDGSSRVFRSSGPGFMRQGSGLSGDMVGNAAKEMVASAAKCLSQTHTTTSYPLPTKGEVSFYLLTDNGVLTASASESDLKSKKQPLSKLWRAGQNLMSLCRLEEPW